MFCLRSYWKGDISARLNDAYTCIVRSISSILVKLGTHNFNILGFFFHNKHEHYLFYQSFPYSFITWISKVLLSTPSQRSLLSKAAVAREARDLTCERVTI